MEPEDQEKEIEMQSEPLIINTQGGAVNSVNGKTGDVVLTTSDLENTSDYQTGAEVDSAIDSAINELNIPTKTSELTNDGEDGTSSYVEEDELAAVAKTGSYNDLDNKPTIPTVNDATLTITQNGVSKGTFTANDADDTTIEVSDTTYTAGTGIDITNNVISSTGGGGPTVVQTTGTSTTDVMSQNATSSMVFADPGTDSQIKIGANTSNPGANGILIGKGAYNTTGASNNIAIGTDATAHAVNTYDCIALGDSASSGSHSSIAIGRSATVGQSLQGSIALGAYSTATRKGEVNIGTSWNATGYNNTAYRLIGGVHDPVDAHDAATKGYVDAQSGGGGGDTVYSDKTTSNSSNGGAVYIGNLDSSQQEQPDPTTTDNYYKYFWALPDNNSRIPADSSVNILGDCRSEMGVIIGRGAYDTQNTYYNTAMGSNAHTGANVSAGVALGFNSNAGANNGIAIGRNASIPQAAHQNSVALGSFAQTTRKGEMNIGTGGYNVGFNNTDYRLIGGVHDGQQAHDAVTVEQVNATIDAINTAMGTSIPHIGA